MKDVSLEIDNNSDEGSVYSIFEPVFKELQTRIQKDVKLGHGTALQYADMMILFSCNIPMAKVVIKNCVLPLSLVLPLCC